MRRRENFKEVKEELEKMEVGFSREEILKGGGE